MTANLISSKTRRLRLAALRRKAAAGVRDERGVVAIIFALAIVVLAPLVLGLFDVYTASEQRAKLQDAVDAAALYAARSTYNTDAEINTAANKALQANLKLIRGATLISSEFHLTDNNTKVVGDATIQPLAIASFWNPPSVSANTIATRSSKNLEVSLVLDVTNSMNTGTRIADLRTAAKDLVDLVVKDVQTPYYSKVAVVPWSAGVNVGSYADSIRGSVAAAKTITGATKKDPVVVTAPNHGFVNDQIIAIDGVVGMTQLNGKAYTVKNKTADTFELYTIPTGSSSVVSSVNGKNYNAYTSGGSVYCTDAGCGYYYFDPPGADPKAFKISTCVSERVGSNVYNDVAPSSTFVGRNYPASGVYTNNPNPCLTNQIIPLTTDKAAVKTAIGNLLAAGSTGGQVGTAWGWYMLSPNFGYLWPTASRPAAYNPQQTMKVVVLMTDGALNTAYCNGVIAKDSLTGSGNSTDHENCNATNGSTFSQSTTLCTNMKEAGIIVYTVGFQITTDATATSFVNSCATDASHVYLPTTGTQLQEAFHAIGQDINGLFLSH